MNVLILEDDILWITMYKKIFKHLTEYVSSYEIVNNLEDAKKLVTSIDFDLFLLDYHLKEGNSLELLELVDPKKVIFVTGCEKEFLTELDSTAYILYGNNDSNFYQTLKRVFKNIYRNNNLSANSLSADLSLQKRLDNSERTHIMMISKLNLIENCLTRKKGIEHE